MCFWKWVVGTNFPKRGNSPTIWRTRSKCPKGLQLEVSARRTPRLLVFHLSAFHISALFYSLDISGEVILREASEVTIDEYPVFLLHLSQPSLHMEYIPKGCFWKKDIAGKMNFNQYYPLFKISFEFAVLRFGIWIIQKDLTKVNVHCSFGCFG